MNLFCTKATQTYVRSVPKAAVDNQTRILDKNSVSNATMTEPCVLFRKMMTLSSSNDQRLGGKNQTKFHNLWMCELDPVDRVGLL